MVRGGFPYLLSGNYEWSILYSRNWQSSRFTHVSPRPTDQGWPPSVHHQVWMRPRGRSKPCRGQDTHPLQANDHYAPWHCWSKVNIELYSILLLIVSSFENSITAMLACLLVLISTRIITITPLPPKNTTLKWNTNWSEWESSSKFFSARSCTTTPCTRWQPSCPLPPHFILW